MSDALQVLLRLWRALPRARRGHMHYAWSWRGQTLISGSDKIRAAQATERLIQDCHPLFTWRSRLWLP